MGGILSILDPVISVEPGGAGAASVRIQNTSDIVEQYSFSVVGEPSTWASVEPPVLSVYPANEGVVIVHFRPPRSSEISAGSVHYGVRVTAKEDSDYAQVEEATVQIGGFMQLESRIVPRTSKGKRGATHRVELTNHGNSPVHVGLEPIDPDDVLLFTCDPWELDVPPASTMEAEVKLRARETFSSGPPRRRGFQVSVENNAGVPITLDAAFEQRKKIPFILIAAAVAIVGAVVVFLLQREGPRGLQAAYFENTQLEGESRFGEVVSDYAPDPGALFRNFDRNPPPGLPKRDEWGARFSGQIRFPERGTYLLQVNADDGVRLSIDGELLIDHFVPGAGFKPDGVFENTQPGSWHDITIEYFEGDGTALIALHWTPPGGAQELVPGENLRPGD